MVSSLITCISFFFHPIRSFDDNRSRPSAEMRAITALSLLPAIAYAAPLLLPPSTPSYYYPSRVYWSSFPRISIHSVWMNQKDALFDATEASLNQTNTTELRNYFQGYPSTLTPSHPYSKNLTRERSASLNQSNTAQPHRTLQTRELSPERLVPVESRQDVIIIALPHLPTHSVPVDLPRKDIAVSPQNTKPHNIRPHRNRIHSQFRPGFSFQFHPQSGNDSAVNSTRGLRPSNTTRVYLNHTTEPHHPIATKAPTPLFNPNSTAFTTLSASSLAKPLLDRLDLAMGIEDIVKEMRKMQLETYRRGSTYERHEKRATFNIQEPYRIYDKTDGKEAKKINKPFRLTRGAGVMNGHYDGVMRSSSIREESDCGPLDYKYLNERCVKSNKLY